MIDTTHFKCHINEPLIGLQNLRIIYHLSYIIVYIILLNMTISNRNYGFFQLMYTIKVFEKPLTRKNYCWYISTSALLFCSLETIDICLIYGSVLFLSYEQVNYPIPVRCLLRYTFYLKSTRITLSVLVSNHLKIVSG